MKKCELQTVVSAGIDAAQAVVDSWESGDLAGAVNLLEDWATQAADYLPDEDGVYFVTEHPESDFEHVELGKCEECNNNFDDNPGKNICQTCEDWRVVD